MPLSRIDIDWEVFAREGDTAFGAVREIHPDHLIVWIENRGDTRIDAEHVSSAHDGKIIIALDGLPTELREAIGRAHDAESVFDPAASDEP